MAARRRQRSALATKALRHQYGDDCFERFAAVPEGWLPSTNTVYVEPKDQAYTKRVELHLEEYRPLPATVSYGNPIPLDARLTREVIKYLVEGETLKSERETLSPIIWNALRGFTTAEALAERWPEAAAKMKHSSFVGTLPMVTVDSVRDRISAAKAGKSVRAIEDQAETA